MQMCNQREIKTAGLTPWEETGNERENCAPYTNLLFGLDKGTSAWFRILVGTQIVDSVLAAWRGDEENGNAL